MAATMFLRLAAPLLGVSLALSACAQQPRGSAQPSGGMSGTNMQGHDMSGMSGMQGHDMSGMDMDAMMSHCADMRQQARQGAAMSPDMRSMLAQCDQMDRQMGGVPASAPRTRTR